MIGSSVSVSQAGLAAVGWLYCPCLDLSVHFGRPAFSLSVVIITSCGTTLTSAGDAEETMRIACETVRGRTECGGVTGMAYLD